MSDRSAPSRGIRLVVNPARGTSHLRGRYYRGKVTKGKGPAKGGKALKKIESKTSDISSKTSDSKSTGVSGASPKGKGKAGKKGAAAGAKKGKAAAAATAKEDDIKPVVKKKGAESTGDADGDLAELLVLSRTMADVFARSLDAMLHLSRDTQNTATAMRALAEVQSGKKYGQGGDGGPGGAGTYYDKLGFMGGNKGVQSREFLESRTHQLVEIRVVFVRIHEIDTVNQVFEAELYIQARWKERRFLGFTEETLAKIEFYQCTDPQLKLMNVVGELDMEKTSMVLRYEHDSLSPVLVYMWHVKGVFRERMELQHFPFDVQELSVVVSTDLPTGRVELVGDFFRASSVNVSALDTSQDWSSFMHVEITRDVSTREMAGVNRHSVLVVSARVKRKLGYYFWNIVVLVFLIEGMTLVFLAVEPDGTTRLSLSMTLFFTAIAYKLVVKNSLPTISYLTYLDVYIGFVMAYLFLWAAVNALMCHLARYRDRQRVLEYDEIAQSCLIGFLLLFHLLFLIYVQLTALARRRQMNNLDAKYKLARLMRQGHINRPGQTLERNPPTLPSRSTQV